MSKQFLLEIGLEEMPAHIVTPTINQLAKKVSDYLIEERLSFDNVDIFSTPRRLAVRVNGLVDKQENIEEVAKGPSKKIAQDAEGNWSKAALGFARGQGGTGEDLFFQEFKGEEYVYINKFIEGKPAADVLQGIGKVVMSLTFPVSMHWAAFDYKFIRPVHWVVALLDDMLVPVEVFNIKSGKTSRGHRFLGQEATINHANEYETKLEEQSVIVNAVIRKNMIAKQLTEIESINNWQIPADEKLLEEINNLIEYPTAFVGNFEEQYLSIPSEVLITSMKEHQRYFEVLDAQGNLLNHFVSVRNGNSEYIDNVISGNEKVLKARLEDAEFFYKEDMEVSIETSVDKLKNVTFHEKIGSVYEKMQRVGAIAQLIGQYVGLDADQLSTLKRASEIYKFDLMTNMVGEFPELQGVIGEKYAISKGETKEVAQAIREHYLPKSSDGELPASDVGAVLAIADKLDTLFAFFTVNLNPTGSNDPYALRRQTYGVIRIVENKEWEFPLNQLQGKIEELINSDYDTFGLKFEDGKESIQDFVKGRMKQWFSGKNIRHDIIEAVVESKQDDLSQMFETAAILESQAEQGDFKPTVESLTRVINLSMKNDADNQSTIQPELFENEAEKALYDAVNVLKEKAGELTLNENFEGLKALNPLIEAYFEQTMVMVEDEERRQNRLNQLTEIAKIALSFASLDLLIVK